MPVEVGRDDHLLAVELARATSEVLSDLREQLIDDGAPHDEFGRRADDVAHRLLVDALASSRPDDAVLSEEGWEDESEPDRRRRLAARRVWILDPLDGTREFAEPPREDWAVHVALAVDGEPVCGAVALPAQGLIFSTARPPAVPAAPAAPRIVVSRTRPPAEASVLAGALGGSLVEMGSAGAKAMAILTGDADVYPHSGGQFEWDSCAPVAVARAAGLWCSRLDGTPLVYNRDDPYLPDLLICRPDHAARVLAALAP